jgi:hypothetical protein
LAPIFAQIPQISDLKRSQRDDRYQKALVLLLFLTAGSISPSPVKRSTVAIKVSGIAFAVSNV